MAIISQIDQERRQPQSENKSILQCHMLTLCYTENESQKALIWK